jgi:glycosyltransferase involved in cell wall biosynthesis
MEKTKELPILLSVVIPCHNEQGIVTRSANELGTYLRTVDWSCGEIPSWEIIFVNDGSTDGTLAELQRLAAADPNVRCVSYRTCGGQGKALQVGFSRARGRWVICFDADLDYKPKYIAEFLEHALKTEADIVVGSPFRAGGGFENCPPVRRWMSGAMNWYFRRVFQGEISTYTAIIRLYRKQSLDLLLLCSFDKDLLPEILIKANTLKMCIEELPVHSIWNPERSKARGKGIGVVSTARKTLRHLSIGLIERPFLFLAYPILVTGALFAYFGFGILKLFIDHFSSTGAGVLVDIRSAFAVSFDDSPHTFIFWLFLGHALLVMFFGGVTILQNKIKGDRDFIVQSKLYELLRAKGGPDLSAVAAEPAAAMPGLEGTRSAAE